MKLTDRFPLAALLLTAGLLAGALYVLGRWDASTSGQDAQTTASSEQLLGTVRAYRQRIARVTAAERWHAERERHWKDSADALSALARGVQAEAEARATAPPDSTALAAWIRAALTWRTTAEAREQEGRECSLVVIACQERVRLATARGDSLQAQLGLQVQVGQCHVNLLLVKFSCPSRTTIAVLSAAVGLATGMAVSQ